MLTSKVWSCSRALTSVAVLVGLAGCSGLTGENSDKDLRAKLRLTRPDWQQNPNPPVDTSRALTADDLVGPDGRCPGGGESQALAEATGAGPGTGTQHLTRGISLEMSECELIRALGNTGQVQISTDEGGQRSVVVTYLQGDRPGIYRFVAGRLKIIERAPEPPPPPKPERPTKPSKKTAAN